MNGFRPVHRPNPKFPVFTTVVFLATSIVALPGRSAELPVTELEPVVVTASALPQRPVATPATVTVIPREEIERAQPQTVSELLSKVPGLHVDRMGSRGGISSVYIRGADPNFTLVMIDGIPINDPTNPRGGSVDLTALIPEHIERIEIVRGPLSSLYGSEAMAGAINIITVRGKAGPTHDFVAEGGSFGYARAAATLAGPLGSLRYSGSIGFTRNDAEVKKDSFEAGNVGLNLDLVDSKDVSLRWTNYYTRSAVKAFPEGSGGPRFALLREIEEREAQEIVSGIALALKGHPHWQQEVSANIFYRAQHVDTPGVQITPGVFQLPPARFDTDYGRYQLAWKHTLRLARNWSAVAGAQMVYEDGRRNGFQQLTSVGLPENLRSRFTLGRLIPAILFETDGAVLKGVKITTGFRFDFPEDHDSEFSPKLGILYRPRAGTDLRINVGSGFKLPSFNALGDPLIGNPNLKPEKSMGVDAGIEQSLGDRHSAAVTYFYNRFSNLVDLDPDLAKVGVFRLVNLSTVVTQGLEASITLRPSDGTTVRGYFNYLYSDVKGTDEPLRNRPMFSGGLMLETQLLDQLRLRADVRMSGKKFDLQIPTRENSTERYVTFGMSLTYAPNENWRIFTVIENLTNTRTEDYVGFPNPGRLIRVGLAYRSK